MKRMYPLMFTIAAALTCTVLVLTPEGAIAHLEVRNGKEVHPNPFTEGTTFQLTMPREAKIKIDVYNIRGQHIRNLFGGEAGELHPPTQGTEGKPIPWDGKDMFGESVPPGIYLCVLQSDGVTIKSVKVVKMEV